MSKLPLVPFDENGRAANDPLSHFKASEVDGDGEPQYFGFLTIDGAWYILKISGGGTTLRYTTGRSGYSTAWINRASLGYDYFDIIF